MFYSLSFSPYDPLVTNRVTTFRFKGPFGATWTEAESKGDGRREWQWGFLMQSHLCFSFFLIKSECPEVVTA